MTTVNPTSTPTLPSSLLAGDPSKFSSLLSADASSQSGNIDHTASKHHSLGPVQSG